MEMLEGRYVPLQMLGSGGSGFVYRAYDTRLRSHVALKIMHDGGTIVDRTRFFREATLRLPHPAFPRSYDIGCERSGRMRPYFTRELLYGETLLRLFHRRASASWPAAAETDRAMVEILCSVLDALAVAHAHGVVHRDVKPDNIFLAEDGGLRVCLIDLGSARTPIPLTEIAGQAATAATRPPETRDYKAPEERKTHLSDLYSVCVVLREALWLDEPRRDLPPRLRELVEIGLRDNPALRHPSALELAGELRALLPELRGPGAKELIHRYPSGRGAAASSRSARTLGWLQISSLNMPASREGDRPDEIDEKSLALQGLLSSQMEEPGGGLDVIFVGGSLSARASSKEMKRAARFLEELGEKVALPQGGMFVLPGPRDVERITGLGVQKWLSPRAGGAPVLASYRSSIALPLLRLGTGDSPNPLLWADVVPVGGRNVAVASLSFLDPTLPEDARTAPILAEMLRGADVRLVFCDTTERDAIVRCLPALKDELAEPHLLIAASPRADPQMTSTAGLVTIASGPYRQDGLPGHAVLGSLDLEHGAISVRPLHYSEVEKKWHIGEESNGRIPVGSSERGADRCDVVRQRIRDHAWLRCSRIALQASVDEGPPEVSGTTPDDSPPVPIPEVWLEQVFVPPALSVGSKAWSLEDIMDKVQKAASGSQDAKPFHAVVMGEPGSGKRTLLNWLAVRWSRCGLTPVVVSLTEAGACHESGSLLDVITEVVCRQLGDVDTKAVREVIESRSTVLLVDGLKESPDVQEREAWVRCFEDLPITSGPSVVMFRLSVAFHKDPRWIHARLQTPDAAMRADLIRRWCEATRLDVEGGGKLSADVLSALAQHPELEARVQTPFDVILLIVAVRRFRQEVIQERADLHEMFLRATLARSRLFLAGRKDRVSPIVQMGYLERLALRMLDERKPLVSLTELHTWVAEILDRSTTDRMRLPGEAEQRAWVRDLQDLGILVEQEQGSIGFRQDSLLRFCAARGLLAAVWHGPRTERRCHDAVKAISARLMNDAYDDDWWIGALKFLCRSHATPSELTDALVGRLCRPLSASPAKLVRSARIALAIFAGGGRTMATRLGQLDKLLALIADRAEELGSREANAVSRAMTEAVQTSSTCGNRISQWYRRALPGAIGARFEALARVLPSDAISAADVLRNVTDPSAFAVAVGMLWPKVQPSRLEGISARALVEWAVHGTTVQLMLPRCIVLTKHEFRAGAAASVLSLLARCAWISDMVGVAERVVDRQDKFGEAVSRGALKVSSKGTTLTSVLRPAFACVQSPWFPDSSRAASGPEKPGFLWSLVPILHRSFTDLPRTWFRSEAEAARAARVAASLYQTFEAFIDRRVVKKAIADRATGRRPFEYYFGRYVDATARRCRTDGGRLIGRLKPLAEYADCCESFLQQGPFRIAAWRPTLTTPEAGSPSPWQSPAASSVEAAWDGDRIILHHALEHVTGLMLRVEGAERQETKLEEDAAALAAVRGQNWWMLQFYEIVARELVRRGTPENTALALALGLSQFQTTWTWPWGETWYNLMAEEPRDWLPGYVWNICRSVAAPEDPRWKAGALAHMRGRIEEWPELADAIGDMTAPILAQRVGDGVV
jgi:serine/threonine-protein kinase